eukprot:CAMPEP_0197823286 /NCGR_PEP_ID=MMETSP1437-20131217/610_1 /TAXON_ID=49252 ORGANISM="Eucampia antarctica, Strain CCMP1452" /NCGR_SAMPLE_ID=MMETSP1437 /ASSEMBLY_ACC=CAM_ASM_001096 /LENGTH=348 /DNA_ID=CAMNT_0043422361 /DNA_START=47 /DNA_END=1093 /DNA_ORIENTATION=-
MVAFLLGAASSVLLALSSPFSGDTTYTTSTEQYSSLLNWLNNTFPSSYVSPSIRLSPSPKGGHGAFATEDISEGSLLFSVPKEACITSSAVLEDKDCGKAFKTLIENAGPGAITVSLAGYLTKEYLCHLEGKESLYGPYLDTLPWKRGWNGQEHVLFWSKDDVEKYLKDSLCWRESNDLRTEVRVAKKIINAVIGPSVLVARGEMEEQTPMIPFLGWTTPPPPKITEPISGLGKALNGAFVILLTRAFDEIFDEEDGERLVPLLDMLNHDNEPTVTYKTNLEGAVEVKARHDIKKGDEIYNRYKEEEDMNMPYHRFFSRFGFVPGVEEETKALLEDKSSIFFAKKKEV